MNRTWFDITRTVLRKMPGYRIARSLAGQLGFNGSGGKKLVPIDLLLCGGEKGLSAAQYARHTGDFLRPSRPFRRSPYVQFLEQYLRVGEEIFHREVFNETAYYANAVECINVVGCFFGCTREDQIEEIARSFVAEFNDLAKADAASRQTACSTFFPSPRVRPVQYSDKYEVIEGNHRLAIACVLNDAAYPVYVIPDPVITPLQQLVLDHAFTGDGRPRLYQPIASPELEKWQLIRRCSDRFEMIRQFLSEHEFMPPRCSTYLDIACNYGWFVKAFGSLGFSSTGVELDWAAVELSKVVYGLLPGQIMRSDAVRFLKNNEKKYDITSCFSLLHHFVLGRASIPAEEMLRLIDERTREVFFFDMGQNHEEWFCESLKEWDDDYIEQWVINNSSFTRIYRLGRDSDSVEPYESNYGRTLFACTRLDPAKTAKG